MSRNCRQQCSLLLLFLLLTSIGSAASRAAISVVGSTSAYRSDYSTASLNLAMPAGLQPGDLVIVQLVSRAGVNSIEPSSAWQLVQVPGYVNVQQIGNIRQRFWWRIVPSGGLGSSQSWGFDAETRAFGGVIALRGVDTTAPFGSSAGQTGNTTTLTAPSVSSAAAGAIWLAAFSGDNGNYGNAALANPPSGMTQTWAGQTANASSNNNGMAVAMSYKLLPAAGATGTANMSYLVSPANWVGISLIIKAAELPDPSGSCTATFPDGASTVNNGGHIQIGNNAVIAGSPDNILDTGNISPNHAFSCTTGSCSADGSGVTALSPGNFQLSTSSVSMSGNNLLLTQASYNDISISNNGQLSYSAPMPHSTFYIDSITAGNGALVNLPPGTYWIRALQLGNNARLNLNGATRIYVDWFFADNGADVNASSQQPFFLYAYTDISFDNNVVMQGVAYARDSITFNNNARLIGAATAGNLISMANNSRIDYDAGVVGDTDFGGLCTSSSIHHYELRHPGSALTCNGASVTVRACADAACNTLFTDSSSVTLSPASGWQGGNNKTLSSGSVTAILRQAAAGAVTLGLSSSTPVAPSPLVCVNTATGSNSCVLNFLDSGFVFDAPDVIANKPSGSFVIRALQKNVANPQQCVPAFQNVTRSIRFWSSYANPLSGTQPMQLSNASSAVTLDTAYNASGSSLALSFNANGEATISSQSYADAGQMQLNARYIGSAATNDAGIDLQGNDLFVSRPAGFCVEALTPITSPSTVLANCANANCAVYQKAGRDFPLRVRAMAWQADGETDTQLCSGNSVTNNFFASVLLSPAMQDSSTHGQLLSGGSTLPASSITLVNGQNTAQIAFSEVGRFRIGAKSSYFAATVPAYASAASDPGDESAVIGRITADNFAITVNSFPAACNAAFSYAGLTGRDGQTSVANVTVRARNAQNLLTQNYQGNYNRFAANPLLFADFDAGNPATDGEFVVAPHTLAFTGGVSTVTPDVFYRFTAPRAPYSIAAQVSATDGDGITGSSAQTAAISYRFGRLFLDNAYGPEHLPLTVPVRAETWNGERWLTETADRCSQYGDSSLITLDQYSGNLAAGETLIDSPLAAQTLIDGRSGANLPLRLSAPGFGNHGSVRLNHGVPSWLLFDWDGNGSHDNAPAAQVTFGRYRGSDRVIDWRVD